jgi:hydrogenase maturation protease
MKWLIVGYGNSLRQDDGFGLAVARQIATIDNLDSTEVIACHQLTPELIEPVSNADFVIFVDASLNRPSDQLKFVTLLNTSSTAFQPAFTHHLSPQTILAGARILYQRTPQAWLLTASAKALTLGEELSAEVEALVPQAVGLILEKIATAQLQT